MGDLHENNDISDESDKPKVDICDNCERVDEDNTFIDQTWRNYTDRPLLPLKPLQKSRSCTNLVQTIKGFSIRKISNSKRYSTPEFQENALVDKRERCTSVGNISRDLKTNNVDTGELKIRSLSDAVRFPQQKNFPWYHPVNGREASKRLLTLRQNGAFLIRPASNPTPEIFYTLCVLFSGRVYNFHVMNLENGYISLGSRKGQKAFSSLLEMIKYHQNVPLSIYLAETNSMANVLLLITPSKGE